MLPPPPRPSRARPSLAFPVLPPVLQGMEGKEPCGRCWVPRLRCATACPGARRPCPAVVQHLLGVSSVRVCDVKRSTSAAAAGRSGHGSIGKTGALLCQASEVSSSGQAPGSVLGGGHFPHGKETSLHAESRVRPLGVCGQGPCSTCARARPGETPAGMRAGFAASRPLPPGSLSAPSTGSGFRLSAQPPALELC